MVVVGGPVGKKMRFDGRNYCTQMVMVEDW